jgi:HK97 family phage major capsid protein
MMLKRFAELYGVVDPSRKAVIGDGSNDFPIPDIVDSEILHFAREVSVILKYARTWDMISEKQSFPIEGTAVSVAWGNTTEESEPDINTEFELDAEELSAFSEVRNTTLADSRSDIVSWLTEALAEAAGQEIDNEGFTGDGTNVCSGILTAACGYSVVLASGSTSFSQLDATKLSEMIGKLDGLKKTGARFWLSGAILHYIRSLKDSQDRPIFIETVGAPMSGTIWGYPYTEVVKLGSITDAANTAFMAFGNLRYFGVGRRLDSSSLSVDPYGKWTTNRTRFKLYQRWGLGIALALGLVRMLTAPE